MKELTLEYVSDTSSENYHDESYFLRYLQKLLRQKNVTGSNTLADINGHSFSNSFGALIKESK